MKKLNLVILSAALSTGALADISHESSLGIVSQQGNTEMNTYNLKTDTKYNTENWDYALGGHYTLGDQKDVQTKEKTESARNWDANIRAGRVIYEKLSGFLAFKVEGDKFAGYTERNNSDIGLTYTFYKTDMTYLTSDLGFRHQITTPIVGRTYESNKGRLFLEHSKKYNANFSSKFWVEYLPDFKANKENGNQLNFEPSLAATLTDTFSLQIAYKGMYNSAPVGAAKKHYDSIFTTSLLAKF